ncbi:MAG: hypothetical protein ACPF83_09250 [Flavobacteriales bacterium]
MQRITADTFSKQDKPVQVQWLRTLGKHLANRRFEGYLVSLFAVEDFYVELWKRVGLDYIDYIEVVRDDTRLEHYVPKLDL